MLVDHLKTVLDGGKSPLAGLVMAVRILMVNLMKLVYVRLIWSLAWICTHDWGVRNPEGTLSSWCDDRGAAQPDFGCYW